MLEPPVFVSYTPAGNVVARYTRERHAPRRLIRTHIGRMGDRDPNRFLADVLVSFRRNPPEQCKVC